MKIWLTAYLLLMTTIIFADMSSVTSELNSGKEYDPEKHTQKSFTTTFLYFSHGKQEFEESDPSYTPGMRLEGILPLGDKWGVNIQVAYSQFAWSQKMTYEAPAAQISAAKGVYINGVKMSMEDLGPNVYTKQQKSDTTFYDVSLFFGRPFFIKSFEIKPVIGSQITYNASNVQGNKTWDNPNSRFTNRGVILKTEEETGSFSSKNRELVLTPALGAFFNQALYRIVSISGFLGGNLLGEVRGNIGFGSTLLLGSESKVSLGLNYEAQVRATPGLKHAKYFPIDSFFVYGFSLMGRFDF